MQFVNNGPDIPEKLLWDLYNAVGVTPDAAKTRGLIPIISNEFVGCQKYLYD